MALQQELRPYQILDVCPDADEEVIEQAYRYEVARLTSYGLAAALPRVHRAYAIVGNPDNRRQYDAGILSRARNIQGRGIMLRRTLEYLEEDAARLARDLDFSCRLLEAVLSANDAKEKDLDRRLLFKMERLAWEGLKALCVARHDLFRAEVLLEEAQQALRARKDDIRRLLRDIDVNDDRFADVMCERNFLHRPAELSWFGSL